MTRVIAIASGKGGVGKTTLVANLASDLARRGHSVVALDGNLTTSNLGIHLGMHLYPHNIHDVISRKKKIEEVMYQHESGFMLIPADISPKKTGNVKASDYLNIFSKLNKGADFVIIDTAAGLGKEAEEAIRAADEIITVTNPEVPAVTDAMKLGIMAGKHGTSNIGVVVNRVRKEKHEVPVGQIEDMVGAPIISVIPEDHHVRGSIAIKKPVVLYKPGSRSALHFKSVTSKILGENYSPRESWTSRLLGIFR